MQNSNHIDPELISRIDKDRQWLLKNIDSGKWPELRSELAELERELSKFILRAKECNSEIK
tara:strand:+ start:690 stop:872 length:183 start_codon:yes stop_codon:yes gene_type:complete